MPESSTYPSKALAILSHSALAFVPLSGFVRPRPIALGGPPQPGEGGCESGWRLGCGEGLAKIVEGHS